MCAVPDAPAFVPRFQRVLCKASLAETDFGQFVKTPHFSAINVIAAVDMAGRVSPPTFAHRDILRRHQLLTPCVRFQQVSPRRKSNVAPMPNKRSLTDNPALLWGRFFPYVSIPLIDAFSGILIALAVAFNSRCSCQHWQFSFAVYCPSVVRSFRWIDARDKNFSGSTPRRPGLNSACVLARRVKSTRPPARLTASGQTASRKTGLPQNPARPAPPPLRFAPAVAPFRQQSFVASGN